MSENEPKRNQPKIAKEYKKSNDFADQLSPELSLVWQVHAKRVFEERACGKLICFTNRTTNAKLLSAVGGHFATV